MIPRYTSLLRIPFPRFRLPLSVEAFQAAAPDASAMAAVTLLVLMRVQVADGPLVLGVQPHARPPHPVRALVLEPALGQPWPKAVCFMMSKFIDVARRR
jgi:hypothetical protein